MNSHTSKQSVIIFDTTLRDGDQSPGYALRIDEKISMAKALASLGVDVIEAGFPVSSDLDFRAVARIATEVKGPRIAALARANVKDIDCAAKALENCERPRIHTFIATSEKHMRDKLGMTPDEVIDAIKTSVGLAHAHMKGRGDVEWSAEDASCSSRDFLIRAVKTAIDAGATTINLPDTVGYTQPSEYEEMFREVIAAVKPEPHIVFSAHAHDDLGMAVANSLAALRGGARQVECTIKGIGERAGNAQMEAIVANINVRNDTNPFSCNIDTRMMKPVADLHSAFVASAPSMMPVTGDNAFAHGSGIHQNGMVKSGCYEIMDPKEYGHSGTRYLLTRHSGEAGVSAVLEEHGISIDKGQRQDFMKMFKQAASEVLENANVRVISPDTIAQWAQKWAQAQMKDEPAPVRGDFAPEGKRALVYSV